MANKNIVAAPVGAKVVRIQNYLATQTNAAKRFYARIRNVAVYVVSNGRSACHVIP